ncbi:MAG: hypothetical protein JWN23_935 [Rhodocyclales bacterium]|nr:hypothetical protein [Rhodocyclales bacterium]
MQIESDPIVRLAVVSDIHAYTSHERSTDSIVNYAGGPRVSNPLSDLIECTDRLGLTADVLVCAGDICNKADVSGLEHAWADLHHLKRKLSASQIVATCGNHDLDSRHLGDETDPDPKGTMLSLVPSFPFDCADLTNKFWSRNYAIVVLPCGAVMVSLNTSAYHGGKQEEILHGRVSKRTIAALAQELACHKGAPAHILVCHHHPLPLSQAHTNDREFMREGQSLLDALVNATGSSWLIVHGHRHQPRLLSGATESNYVPFVFGAGSLGARMPGVSNQCHIVTIFRSSDSQFSSIVGAVETLTWTDSNGWQPATGSNGLPSLCGFGYRGQIPTLAREIATLVGNAFLPIHQIRKDFPSVNFLTPVAMEDLENELDLLGVAFMRDRQSQVVQIGKKAQHG